jgi:hypothetical protein
MFRQLHLYNQMHIWLCACADISLLVRFFLHVAHIWTVPSHMQLCVHTCCCMGTSSFVCAYEYIYLYIYMHMFVCIETCLCTCRVCVHIWPSVYIPGYVCAHLALCVQIWLCVCTSGPLCTYLAVCVHIWPSVCTSSGVCAHLALCVHIQLSMIVIIDVFMKMAV